MVGWPSPLSMRNQPRNLTSSDHLMWIQRNHSAIVLGVTSVVSQLHQHAKSINIASKTMSPIPWPKFDHTNGGSHWISMDPQVVSPLFRAATGRLMACLSLGGLATFGRCRSAPVFLLNCNHVLRLKLHIFIHLSTYLSIYLPTYLSVYLSVYLSTYVLFHVYIEDRLTIFSGYLRFAMRWNINGWYTGSK